MEASSDFIPNPEAKPPEPITPRKIDGMDRPIQQESLGGNAGHMAVALNAIYTGEPGREFIFTNYADRQFGRPKDLAFRLQFPDSLISDLKQGKTPPPALITEVITDAEAGKRALFERRALEHNTAEILEYLRSGGTMEDLISRGVTTQFVPGAKEIQRLLAEKADQPAPDPRRQRKIMAYALTRAKGILKVFDIPLTEGEREQFMLSLRNGTFTRRNLDEMLAQISDPSRNEEYAIQFDLLKRQSGVNDEVFEGKQI